MKRYEQIAQANTNCHYRAFL